MMLLSMYGPLVSQTRLPNLPPGYSYLTDDAGNYLLDEAGAYLYETKPGGSTSEVVDNGIAVYNNGDPVFSTLDASGNPI